MAFNSGKYDVLILGTGASGLYAALNLDSDLNILICSKRELKLSNSSLAQGPTTLYVDIASLFTNLISPFVIL